MRDDDDPASVFDKGELMGSPFFVYQAQWCSPTCELDLKWDSLKNAVETLRRMAKAAPDVEDVATSASFFAELRNMMSNHGYFTSGFHDEALCAVRTATTLLHCRFTNWLAASP